MRWFAGIVIVLFLLQPATALVREADDYTIVDRRDAPVIFIPGVAGSELEADGWNAWPGWLHQRVTGGEFSALAMDEDGDTKARVVPIRSIRKGLEFSDSFIGRWGFFGVYDGFLEYMEDEGFSLDENPETGLRYFEFPYDWRDDNHLTAKKLDTFVNKVRAETKSDKVILYAHSMGGVVARLYLNDPKNAHKVAGVVFLGTPHQGSPKPFYAFVHGYNFGNTKLSDTTMWEIMGNWPAGYQLIPSYGYVQDAETGKFWTTDEIYGTGWVGQQEYDHWKADPENWDLRYGLPNREHAKNVVAFQAELGPALKKYPNLKYYMIEGVDQKTTQYVEATLTVVPELDVPVLSLKEVVTTQGDGTVPTRGAKIDGLDGHYTVPTDHGNIPAFPGSHPIMTELRKTINNEAVRKGRVRAMTEFAQGELDQVASWPDQGSIVAGVTDLFVAILFGKPDEEKVKARDELRGAAKSMLRDARITIVVAEGTPDEDRFFLATDGFEIAETGTGEIDPRTAIVRVDTWETFDSVVSYRTDLGSAVELGTVKFTGAGADRFRAKMLAWLAKYDRSS